MDKLHLVSSDTPIAFSGEDVPALCLKDVPNARAVYHFNLQTGEMGECLSTITFCKVCLQLALTPIGERRVFIYGIKTAQSVMDDSRFNSQPDGEF